VRSAGLGIEEVDRILLVGGCSRIPLVGQTVRELTGRPVSRDSHPKHAIALGAALFAAKAEAAAPPAFAAPVAGESSPVAAAAAPEPSAPGPPAAAAVEPQPAAIPPAPAPAPPIAAVAPAARAPDVPRGQRVGGEARRRAIPRWAWASAGALVVVVVAAVAAVLLAGGEASADVRITDAERDGTTYTVWFESDVPLSSGGNSLVFYWDNAEPESGVSWAGGSPVTFTFERPAGAEKLCVALVPASGSIEKSSGTCWTV
jgi:hypothetical protein